MKTSFKKTTKEETQTELLEKSETKNELATAATGGVEGEIVRSDIILPRLNLVQSVGPLSESFKPGEWIYSKEVALPIPFNMVIVRIKKHYQEKIIPYDPEKRPTIANSEEEIVKLGGTTSWAEHENENKMLFEPVANVLVLIEKPAALKTTFPHEADGKQYGLALWTLRGVAYNRTARKIFTHAVEHNGVLSNVVWETSSERVKAGKNMVWSPLIKTTVTTSEAVQELAKKSVE